ncbi:glycosyltransferase family 2 protein [Kaistia nematophila]|uniref:Glycosyltransferase n=1 Tax=Kaistia nematophila TaxID=2994654 RepID=A0A9X3DYI6_9HYPH|nr:glycosyltransferase family 2 protein [Kaistia nematophila]MCX5568361.1 glycosyltransferase [Kaistia nematophila]
MRYGWDPPGGGTPDEATRSAALAARLGLPFDPTPKRTFETAVPHEGNGDVAPLAAAIRAGRVAMLEDGGSRRLLIAPRAEDVGRLATALAAAPDLAARLTVTTPSAIRRCLTESGSVQLVDHAVSGFDRAHPDLSARRLLTSAQVVFLLFCLALGGLALWHFGWQAVQVVNIALGILFLALILLRLLAVSVALERTFRPAPPLDVDRSRLPVYSVLVPLYDEAHMVADLARALEALDWPKDRLDIKFIVEERDRATRHALERLELGREFEILVVPDRAPRTKPKALDFALPLARGRFVTVYDAEDRPDPGQLLEAYLAFASGDERLACIQAPLLVDNDDVNGLTAFFAMEYSMQFDGVLPTLVALDMPLPLGGTSNHFRIEALRAVGGWDPYNVTEDADLGIRFARCGYRSGTITRPTYEEAPRTMRLWLKQRTRWLKGWMQTFLVHMRHPVRLWRSIGSRRMLGFLLTGFGTIVAAAIHPVYIASAVALAIDPTVIWRAGSPLAAAVIFLNVFNFVAGYVVFALLSRATLRLRRKKRQPGVLPFLPGYWLLLSLACYRAFFQLLVAPHRWEKTQHHGQEPRRRSVDSGEARGRRSLPMQPNPAP